MRKNKIKDFIITAGGEFKKAIKLVVNGIAELAGEALSACETKKVVSDIQAKSYLNQLERQATLAPPMLMLNPAQEQVFVLPEFRGTGASIQLDHAQAEFVFQHMLKQHALDTDSREQLASMVAPLVGVPALMQSVYKAHEYIGKNLILPYVNRGKTDEFKIPYENTVNNPVYMGTNQGIVLKYNLHSPDLCKKFCSEYVKSRQYVSGIQNTLQTLGAEISHVKTDGIHLEVYLKWA